jgi:guanidinopropionase
VTEDRHPVPEQAMPRFAGASTFMKLPPYRPDRQPDVVVVGAPFDGGTTFRPGARHGPEAMRRASAGLYPYHRGHDLFLTEAGRVVDAGDLFVVPTSVERTLESLTRALGAFPPTSRVLLLGGDHSVSLAGLRRAAALYGPVALVHLDAHTDLWDEFWGERYNHGTVMRRAVEEGLIRPAHSIQIGLRGSLDARAEDRYGEELGIAQISTDRWWEWGTVEVAKQVTARVDGLPTYLTVDVDVVDPAFAPGTGTPEAGGPTSHMVLSLMKRVAVPSVPVVGADVVEVSPPLDAGDLAALFGATVAHEILFQMVKTAPTGPRVERDPGGHRAPGGGDNHH